MADVCAPPWNREHLRPWLEGLLNRNTIDGVCWVEGSRTIFKIPWYHHRQPNWSPEKGQIFKEWAIHTGRYREGVDDEEWSRWKTRLRCALNKAADFKELKQHSRISREEEHPYKVYELQPRQACSTGASSARRPSCVPVHNDSLPPSYTTAPLPVVLSEFDEEAEGLPSDLEDIDDLFLPSAAENRMISGLSDMSIDDLADILCEDVVTAQNGCDDHEMMLRLFYCGYEVLSKTISKQNGCCLYYGGSSNTPSSIPVEIQAQVNSESTDKVWLPPCYGLMNDEDMERKVQRVVENGMKDGIYLRTVNNNILVSRFCKCSIYYASFLGTGGNPQKLNHCFDVDGNVDTVIFDYAKCFLPAIEQYTTTMGSDLLTPPAADPRVYVMIGSEETLSELNERVPIYAEVTTKRAWKEFDLAINKKKNSEQSFGENMSCDSLEFPDYEFAGSQSWSRDNWEDHDAFLDSLQPLELVQPVQPVLDVESTAPGVDDQRSSSNMSSPWSLMGFLGAATDLRDSSVD